MKQTVVPPEKTEDSLKQTHVICIGDSYTEGFFLPKGAKWFEAKAKPYSDLLSQLLNGQETEQKTAQNTDQKTDQKVREADSEAKFVVINSGWSGEKTKPMLERITAQLNELKSEGVVCKYG